MKSTANRLVLLIGAFILALMAIDGLVQLNDTAMDQFGYGQSAWVNADSAAALFMIGLVAGMVLGIGIFFAYIVWREKKYAEEPDEVRELLDEVSRDMEQEDNPLYVDDPSAEEFAEPTDPWERPADWWKSDQD